MKTEKLRQWGRRAQVAGCLCLGIAMALGGLSLTAFAAQSGLWPWLIWLGMVFVFAGYVSVKIGDDIANEEVY